MEIKDLQKIMQDNGVVGAGGAGFPSYAKLTDKADTILLNCAECEPLLKLHRQLLEKHAYEIMKTFHTVMETVGASQAIIGIRLHLHNLTCTENPQKKGNYRSHCSGL